MYDSPAVLLDPLTDEHPTTQLTAIDLTDLPPWPIVDRDPPVAPDDQRLTTRADLSAPVPDHWAPVTLDLLREVLDGLHRLR